jgi:hypothetical protein
MDIEFFCPECRSAHVEPADARLGHLVVCTECALAAAPAIDTIRLDADSAPTVLVAA